jgi:hypothetical protein
MSTEKTITAKARASGKMTVDDLREFLAELEKSGGTGGVFVSARVSFGGWIKSVTATVRPT